MKTIFLLLLVTLSVKLGAQTMSMGHVTIPLSNPGKPYSINVELGSANIKLAAYAGKEVIIDVMMAETKKESASENGRPRLNLSAGSDAIITRESKNAVTVINGAPSRETLFLTIRLPAGATNIRLSLNSGTVNASAISGNIEVSNTHGNITLDNVSGSVVANTNDGNIQVVFTSVDVNAAMAFSSLRGSIYVTVPANFKANVKLRSDYGYIYSDFDVAVEKTGIKGIKTTPDRPWRWRTDSWVNGRIGDGGQELMIKNHRGDIYLHKAK